MNNDIFKYISKSDNTFFSSFKGEELEDLFVLIDDVYMELRENLGLSNDITFGLEIEFEESNNVEIEKWLEVNHLTSWYLHDDVSLKRGGEVTSSILYDKKETYEELDAVCSIIKKQAKSFNNAGGHIHIGSQIINKDSKVLLKLLKLWAVYENIIFRFSYGEYLTGRRSIDHYAKVMHEEFIKVYEKYKESDISFLELIKVLQANTKYQALNFNNVKQEDFDYGNTLEVRCPNATLNSVIWQNNVNFFTKLFTYAKSLDFDYDKLDRRYNINKDNYNLYSMYNEIYLRQALELCDLIFNNNLDKVYFLRQYIKSFEVGDKPFVRAKVMTV
mgnify:CR=1 FL=1